MYKLIGYIFISLLFMAPARAEVAPDKTQHFLATYGINTTLLAAMPKGPYRRITAGLITMSIGLAKELSDEKIDPSDLYWDWNGVVASNVVSWVFCF